MVDLLFLLHFRHKVLHHWYDNCSKREES